MQFTGKNGEFQIRHMVEKTQLNFPVANEEGIKSSVMPEKEEIEKML